MALSIRLWSPERRPEPVEEIEEQFERRPGTFDHRSMPGALHDREGGARKGRREGLGARQVRIVASGHHQGGRSNGAKILDGERIRARCASRVLRMARIEMQEPPR